MKDQELIRVLWVEDDPKVIETYPLEAGNDDLVLQPFSCWDEARQELEDDYNRWSAIILDAKCKFHKESNDNAIIFLREALKDISVLAEKHKRVIPWYVLSGGAEEEISDSINEERLKWDEDWTNKMGKCYYAKGVDNSALFKRIKEHASHDVIFQIHKLYEEVFVAIKECSISDKARQALEDLLVPIHFPRDVDNNNYNYRFENVRIILENIFRTMGDWGILPKWSGDVNLRGSYSLLGYNNKNSNNPKYADSKEGRYIKAINSNILPEIILDSVRIMINSVPTKLHDSIDKNRTLTDYLSSVNNSSYLLKSFALQLCDLILWYRKYLQTHHNYEENAKNWKLVNQ